MKKDDHLIFEAYNSNKVRWVRIKDGIYTTHKANIMGKIVEIDNQAGFPYAVTIHHSDRKETVDFDKFDGWRIKSIKEYLQQTNLDKGIPLRSGGVASGEVLPMDIDKINELYYQHKSKITPKAFRELQDAQRGEPENMFSSEKNPGAGNSQLLQFAMEHTGDLIHRVAYMDGVNGWGGATGVDYGMNAGRIKADRVLYGKKDLILGGAEAQARDNWKYLSKLGKTDLTEDQWMQQMRDAGKRYADAYKKLKPITKAQEAAQEAAIALGEGNYDLWAKKVQEVKDRVANKSGYMEMVEVGASNIKKQEK